MNLVPVKKDEKETEESKNLENMSLEHFNIICNPAFYALKKALESLKESPSIEIIKDIHDIMLIDNSQKHSGIQKIIPEIYPYIFNEEFYDAVCLLICDISHLNQEITDSLLDFQIKNEEKQNYSTKNGIQPPLLELKNFKSEPFEEINFNHKLY